MSLQEELLTFQQKNIEQLPADINAVMQEETRKQGASNILDSVPKVGDTLADFTLPNHQGDRKSLSELREKGPVVITFYRGGWCPYCNMELRAYQNILAEINETGATLIAISPELPDQSLTTAEKNQLKFDVFTDISGEYIKEIGLSFTLPESLQHIYPQLGINVEKHNGTGEFTLPLAGTLIVDSEGKITYAFVDTDYTKRADPCEIVEHLRRLEN